MNDHIPVQFKAIRFEDFTEIEWRMFQVECKKYGCYWKFSEENEPIPIFPTDCDGQCKEYIKKEIHDKALKND